MKIDEILIQTMSNGRRTAVRLKNIPLELLSVYLDQGSAAIIRLWDEKIKRQELQKQCQHLHTRPDHTTMDWICTDCYTKINNLP